MRYLILGAGGIGCYYGARLQAAGHDVVFHARNEHLQAMQRQGLRVEHPEFVFDQPVKAADSEALQQQWQCEDFDLIIVAAKATATQPLMESLAGWLQSATTPILSLQNGVDNEAEIAAVVGRQRTWGGLAVKIGGHILTPGQVGATGIARIEMGAWPNFREQPDSETQLHQHQRAFENAAIPCVIDADIQLALWRKLVINNGVNPLSALTSLTTRQLTSDAVLAPMVREMMTETVRAARQQGIGLQTEDATAMFELISGFDDIKTSMLVDREKGRPLELQQICQPVIRGCSEAGQAAQTTERVQRLLQLALQVDGCKN